MVYKSILFLALSFLLICCTNPPSEDLYLNTIQANETGMANLQEVAKDSKTAEALYATINANETEITLLNFY